MVTVDTKGARKLLRDIDLAIQDSWDETGTYFKNVTPVRTGNARNRTKQVANTITADYAYAGRLDEGWSKQAPTGMTAPSVDYFVDKLTARIGRL
jgi:hypothetical protein